VKHYHCESCVDKSTIPCSLFEIQMTSLYFVTRIVQVDIICFSFCVDQDGLDSHFLFLWFFLSWGHEKKLKFGGSW